MSNELKFYLVTDTHHYAFEKLGFAGGYDQKCMNESGAIIDAAFDKFIGQDEIDIVLIAGDLTNNGERESHREFVDKLRRLKAAGKSVYLITATHDYGLREAKDGESDCGRALRNELRGMYNDFGFHEAIAEYKDGLSYVARLQPGYRLLALNDDGNGRSFCGSDDDQLQWVLDQIKSAREDGEYLFAMTHHPVLPPSPVYPVMSKRDMHGGYETVPYLFADAGLQFIFTGHSHMQNIGFLKTPKGNVFCDINTGSLVGYPTPIRRVTLDGEKMTVTTEKIDTFQWDFKGKEPQDYLRDHFDHLLNDIFDSMAYDFEKFAGLAGGFSMERKTAEKLKIPIKLIGKTMQKLTLGKAGRLLFVKRKIDKSVQNMLIKDLVVEIVRNIFSGNEHYSPDTAVYKAVMVLLKRLNPLLKRFVKGSDAIGDIPSFIGSLLYDDTPDTDAVIPVHKVQDPVFSRQ